MIHMPDCADVEVRLGPCIHIISTEASGCVLCRAAAGTASMSRTGGNGQESVLQAQRTGRQ